VAEIVSLYASLSPASAYGRKVQGIRWVTSAEGESRNLKRMLGEWESNRRIAKKRRNKKREVESETCISYRKVASWEAEKKNYSICQKA